MSIDESSTSWSPSACPSPCRGSGRRTRGSRTPRGGRSLRSVPEEAQRRRTRSRACSRVTQPRSAPTTYAERPNPTAATLENEGAGQRSGTRPFLGFAVSQNQRNVRCWSSSTNGSRTRREPRSAPPGCRDDARGSGLYAPGARGGRCPAAREERREEEGRDGSVRGPRNHASLLRKRSWRRTGAAAGCTRCWPFRNWRSRRGGPA